MLKRSLVALAFFLAIVLPISFQTYGALDIAHAAPSCLTPTVVGEGLTPPTYTCEPSDLSAQCQTALNAGNVNTPACSSSDDQQVLKALGINTLTPGANSSQTNQALQNAGITKAPECSSFTTFFSNFTTCVGRSISAIISEILVYIASWILAVAGLLFNLALSATVLNFGSLVNSNIITGINTAWTAFRDISNIVIIGMFTFIAISLILGNKEYGQKKLVARVLVVAILINFSLLFTKIIIDTSNFTAIQFYTAASNGNPDLQNSAVDTSLTQVTGGTQQAGVAGAFMRYAGVAKFGDTFSATKSAADKLNNGFLALLFGVVVAVMYLAVAVILFYGSFLLISRALLFVFLMITSSLAFASYLIPSLSKGGYGWSTWWSSLLKNAILAPLLMVFLWVTLTIAKSFAATTGTLGDLIKNPQNTLDLNALLGYCIVVGLLFLSFKVSSSFATSIGGFDFAAAVPAYGAGLVARAGGFLGRQTIGRAGLIASDKLQKASQDQNRSLLTRQLYNFGSKQLKKTAQSDFNAARTPLGSAIQRTAGFKKIDAIAGEKKKGFEGTEKARAEAYVADADRMKATDDQKKKFAEDARNEVLKADPELARRHTEATQTKENGEKEVEKLQKAQGAMIEEFSKSLKPLQEAAEQLKQAAAANPADATVQERLRNASEALGAEKNRQRSLLDEQGQRISAAKLLATRGAEEVKKVQVDLDNEAVRRGLRPKEYKDEKQLASEMAFKRVSNAPFRLAGVSTESNDRIAKLASKGVGEHHKKKSAKEAVKALQEIAGHEDHGAAPAAGGAGAHGGADHH